MSDDLRPRYALTRSVDFTALRDALIERLGRTVEVVGRPPKDADNPGVVIVESRDGDALEINADVLDAAVTDATRYAQSAQRHAVADLARAATVDQQLSAIRRWLTAEVEKERDKGAR